MSDEPFDTTETQAAIIAGQLIGDPAPIDETAGRFHVIATPPGSNVRVLDVDAERNATAVHPDRKAGRYTVFDAAGFVSYVTRHATEYTELYADVEKLQILAVFDGHGPAALPDAAGREQHRATLVLRHTPAWKAWLGIDRKLLSQVEFAEHVEDRLVDVAEPPAADLLEIAQTLISKKSVDFEGSNRLQDGNTVLEYREHTATTAGKKGELAVPDRITLGLIPFRGADMYKVTARLRTRLDGARLFLGVVLDRPEDVIETAFNDIVQVIGEELSPTQAGPIVNGWPQH